MIILLHSSKTMKPAPASQPPQTPQLLSKASQLHAYVANLSEHDLARCMKISPALAQKTAQTLQQWNTNPQSQSLALDAFKGDIYSGLQAPQFTNNQRQYAHKHLVILSGLYGLIRPFDGIMPYRLEMMYSFPDKPFDNLYNFWGSRVADLLPKSGIIINTSSVEYSRLITPFVDSKRIITPQFYTRNAKTGEPTFVTVHTKIARGAFARWLITTQTTEVDSFNQFDLLGYTYEPKLSKPSEPAFVTPEFGGIGLSIRLTT